MHSPGGIFVGRMPPSIGVLSKEEQMSAKVIRVVAVSYRSSSFRVPGTACYQISGAAKGDLS